MSVNDRNDLLEKIVTLNNPTKEIGHFIISNFPLKSADFQSYSEFEQKISAFEQWLYESWGNELYELLVPETKEDISIIKAFNKASEVNANILIADGFSMRELILLLVNKFKDRIVSYEIAYAYPPTMTTKAASVAFDVSVMKDIFLNKEIILGDKSWKTKLIEDPTDPPRIGYEKGYAFYSYYPDAPLHNAQAHGTTLQNIGEVIEKLFGMIKGLSKYSDLVITGDHGYIFLGNNPNLYLWKHIKSSRFGENIKKPYLVVEEEKVAIGRYHAMKSKDSFITHGGISLMESLVPIVIVRREM